MGYRCSTRDRTSPVLACKRYLCARPNLSNNAVMGECGRYPLSIKRLHVVSVIDSKL